MTKPSLPIDEFLTPFTNQLKRHSSIVLSASPGAGKTTRIPPEILKVCDKAVWVLEPRRIAAISAAHRIAEENGWDIGKQVGYQVRYENKSSKDTKLLFLTEALLLRKMLRDPKLSNVGCVVLDEFHERSIHVDLALGALKELQELERPDLKIVVMSATLNAKPLSEFLNDAPVIEIPGKMYPLEIHHDEKPFHLKTDSSFTERMGRMIKVAAAKHPGNLLCFLPGRGEIERLKSSLETWATSNSIDLYSLHGQLRLSEQKEALSSDGSQRKVILSTNVAESSLTVPGVRIVVDSGLARRDQQNSKTGLESLEIVRISRASATQRAGRAAREGSGVVYRAWSLLDERSMEDFELAEIFRKDLSETLLLLAALGVTHPENFTWFEPPLNRSLILAKDCLISLGALTSEGSLSPLGVELQKIPLHPRLAALLVKGSEMGLSHLAVDLAALLSEGKGRVDSAAFTGAENDLLLRLEDWKKGSRPSRHLDRAADQLRHLMGATHQKSSKGYEEMAELLLSVYLDRLSRRRRRHEPEAKMAGGRGVKLHKDSSVRESEFFLSLELTEGRGVAEALVFQAVGLSLELIQEKIEPLAKPQTRLEWDKEKEKFFTVEFKEWRGLSVSTEHRRPATPEETEGRLFEVLFLRWSRLLEENQELGQWMARLHFLNNKNSEFPSLNEEQIKEALEAACFGENSVAKVEEKKLVPYFEGILSQEHRSMLERECPEFWVVPTGSRIQIQYTEEQGALVEVRLQELFGLERAPVIAGQPLTLFLLAPNYRPVQVTRDLSSFWTNGYPEVRKELRMRYPKHSWPEDPRTAVPQAKGRPRK